MVIAVLAQNVLDSSHHVVYYLQRNEDAIFLHSSRPIARLLFPPVRTIRQRT